MSTCLPRAAFFAVLLSGAVAQGQQGPATGKVGARAHFNEGLAHVAQGEFERALHEFEAAYALKPHYSVLYNIGQAQAELGRPAEALRRFERYLLLGGAHLSQARRDEVRALIAKNRARLGEVRLVGVVATTRVWVDGVEVEPPALRAPLLLTSGKHAILSSNGGGFPHSQEVIASAARSTEVKLPAESVPVSPPAPPPAAAQLRIVCDLPGVDVAVGDTTHVKTPVPRPLAVTSGPLTVRFSRAGYRPITQRVVASPGARAIAMCDQVMEDELEPAVQATLVVQTVPFDAAIFIDGDRFLGARLPYGPHEMRIERDGFVTARKSIALRPRDVTTYQIALSPTPARQRERAQARLHRNVIGYATGGTGLALAITGGALYGWNSGRYDDWSRDGNTGTQLQTVSSIQRMDDIAIGCAALGAGLITAGAWLLLTPPAELSSR